MSDASHGNEEVWIDEWEVREPFRSQGAKMIFFADTQILQELEAHVHVISFASTIQPRVVNSAIKAETYQLSHVVEGADLLRAAIADLHGALDHCSWETSAAGFIRCKWFTDCKSGYDTLQKPIAKSVDKRLGMELASLRQHLWRDSGSHMPHPRMLEEQPKNPSDVLVWIDTSVMVCDCLTKNMRDEYMMKVLDGNHWNFEQTAEAKEVKAKKQLQRSVSKKQKQMLNIYDSEPERDEVKHSDPEADVQSE